MSEGVTLDNEMGERTGFEIKAQEKTDPKKLANGQEVSLKETVNYI
jgi:hypothetical protein